MESIFSLPLGAEKRGWGGKSHTHGIEENHIAKISAPFHRAGGGIIWSEGWQTIQVVVFFTTDSTITKTRLGKKRALSLRRNGDHAKIRVSGGKIAAQRRIRSFARTLCAAASSNVLPPLPVLH
jgi:hypothetical protein